MTGIALAPIAMPLLSGPGSIAVTISMATEVSNILDYVPVGIGIVLASFASWLVLRSASRIIDILGSTDVNVLTRLMGLILVCIGVEFVVTGILQLLTDEAVVNAISQAYPG